MNRRVLLGLVVGAIATATLLALAMRSASRADAPARAEAEAADEQLLDPLPQTEEQWRKVLNRQEYRILRLKETERAFTGKYWRTKTAGIYRCAGCGQPLFSSEHKFDSGTGWPSYWQPIEEDCVSLQADYTWFFGRRTEVLCSRCKGHLGHVFNDGPRPTGLRFCINSAALKLDESNVAEKSAAKRKDLDEP